MRFVVIQNVAMVPDLKIDLVHGITENKIMAFVVCPVIVDYQRSLQHFAFF